VSRELKLDRKTAGIRLAVMDMWRAFDNSTVKNAPGWEKSLFLYLFLKRYCNFF